MELNGRTNLPEAFDVFRQTFIATLSDTWQRENLYKVENRADIHVQLPVNNLEIWYRLRTLLAELPIVHSITVLRLTSTSGVLKLKLSGSVEALQMAVRSTGYRLEASGDVYRLNVNPAEANWI